MLAANCCIASLSLMRIFFEFIGFNLFYHEKSNASKQCSQNQGEEYCLRSDWLCRCRLGRFKLIEELSLNFFRKRRSRLERRAIT